MSQRRAVGARGLFIPGKAPGYPECTRMAPKEEDLQNKRWEAVGPLSCQVSGQVSRPRLRSWCELYLTGNQEEGLCYGEDQRGKGLQDCKMELLGCPGLSAGTPHPKTAESERTLLGGQYGNPVTGNISQLSGLKPLLWLESPRADRIELPLCSSGQYRSSHRGSGPGGRPFQKLKLL